MVLINFLFGLKADHQFLHTKPLRILNTLPRNPPDCDCDRPAVRWDESRTDAPRRRRGSRCSGAKTSSLAPQLDSRPPSLLPYQRRIVPKVSIFPPDSSDTMTWTDDDAALNDHFHLLFRSMLDANARSARERLLFGGEKPVWPPSTPPPPIVHAVSVKIHPPKHPFATVC